MASEPRPHFSESDRNRTDLELRIRGDISSEEYVRRLKAKADRHRALRLDRIKVPCGVCDEHGVIRGFWYGTVKTCPACHGKGYR